MIYNVKASGSISDAGSKNVSMLIHKSVIKVFVLNISIDITINGINVETTGLVNLAENDVTAVWCTVKIQSAQTSQCASLMVGFMQGGNLTLLNNTVQGIITSSGNENWFYAALFCGKIKLTHMNMTNNRILPSTLKTTSRGAMITSHLEGAGRLYVNELKIDATTIEITKESISSALLIAETNAAVIDINKVETGVIVYKFSKNGKNALVLGQNNNNQLMLTITNTILQTSTYDFYNCISGLSSVISVLTLKNV